MFSAADEKLAAEWYWAGVPLDQVQRAILMGCTRKYVALFNHPGGSPITCLQYFAGIMQEVATLDAVRDLVPLFGSSVTYSAQTALENHSPLASGL
jgi:hypothetical protein